MKSAVERERPKCACCSVPATTIDNLDDRTPLCEACRASMTAELPADHEALRKRLDAIAAIIEGVDNRCLAVDGPVSKTREEITDDELRAIYKHATRHRKAPKATKEWWIISVANYGTWAMFDTEAKVEEMRCHKARWEHAVARKVRANDQDAEHARLIRDAARPEPQPPRRKGEKGRRTK